MCRVKKREKLEEVCSCTAEQLYANFYAYVSGQKRATFAHESPVAQW